VDGKPNSPPAQGPDDLPAFCREICPGPGQDHLVPFARAPAPPHPARPRGWGAHGLRVAHGKDRPGTTGLSQGFTAALPRECFQYPGGRPESPRPPRLSAPHVDRRRVLEIGSHDLDPHGPSPPRRQAHRRGGRRARPGQRPRTRFQKACRDRGAAAGRRRVPARAGFGLLIVRKPPAQRAVGIQEDVVVRK